MYCWGTYLKLSYSCASVICTACYASLRKFFTHLWCTVPRLCFSPLRNNAGSLWILCLLNFPPMTTGLPGYRAFHTAFCFTEIIFSVKYHTLYSYMCNISSITSLTKNPMLPHSMHVHHTCQTHVKHTASQITLMVLMQAPKHLCQIVWHTLYFKAVGSWNKFWL